MRGRSGTHAPAVGVAKAEVAVNDLGSYLRGLRQGLGWSQEALEEQSGVPQTTIDHPSLLMLKCRGRGRGRRQRNGVARRSAAICGVLVAIIRARPGGVQTCALVV